MIPIIRISRLGIRALSRQKFALTIPRFGRCSCAVQKDKQTTQFVLTRHFSNLKAIGWLPETVPNPKSQPAAAGRFGVGSSNVCDPDQLLNRSSQDTIEGYIKRCKFEAAVVLINNMAPSYISVNGNSKQDAAGAFARALHDLWGVGDPNENDGVLLLLSAGDRVVYISAGAGLKDKLEENVIESVIEGMKTHLAAGDFGAAMEYAVLSIEDIVQNEHNTDRKGGRSTAGYGSVILLILCMALMVAFAKLRTQEKVKKGVESFKHVFDSDDVSCPYCLEAYGESEKVKVQCGHCFCERCIKELLGVAGQEVGTCVICAKPLKLPEPEALPEAAPARQDPGLVDPFDSDSPRHESSHSYRVNRFFDLFDSVIDKIDFDALLKAAGGDDSAVKDDATRVIVQQRLRDARVRRQMQAEASREKARREGSSGSDSGSFGGGSSSGGKGSGGSF